MNEFAEEKFMRLKEQMAVYARQKILIAFSGGVDSSLLLALAAEGAADRTGITAVTMQTRLHPAAEIRHAESVAAELHVRQLTITVDELAEAGITDNPKDRCYRCKKYLFEKIRELAEETGAAYILEGTNADDLHVYRPGIRAIRELGILSPLAGAGLTKAEVRSLAGRYGVSVEERPSMPCMATRFPYGVKLTSAALERAEEGEAYLRGLGFYNVRLRVHGETARIEVDQTDFDAVVAGRDGIIRRMKELGYRYVTLDLEGFRSGSMDAGL